MKLKNYIILCAFGVLALMTSCVSQEQMNATYFKPNVVRLEMSMQDMVYLGDVTVDVEYKRYLGVFVKILKVNGEDYNPRYQKKASLTLTPKVSNDRYLNKALYKVQEVYPNADYIIPVSKSETRDLMFGGRIVHEQMRVKVYKLK